MLALGLVLGALVTKGARKVFNYFAEGEECGHEENIPEPTKPTKQGIDSTSGITASVPCVERKAKTSKVEVEERRLKKSDTANLKIRQRGKEPQMTKKDNNLAAVTNSGAAAEQPQSQSKGDVEERRLKKSDTANLKIRQRGKEPQMTKKDNSLAAVTNTGAAAEQPQSPLTQWQDERTALQNTIKRLQQTLTEKKQEWSEKEQKMHSRTEELESTINELLGTMSKKKKKGLTAKLFKSSGCK